MTRIQVSWYAFLLLPTFIVGNLSGALWGGVIAVNRGTDWQRSRIEILEGSNAGLRELLRENTRRGMLYDAWLSRQTMPYADGWSGRDSP